jgi:Fe-S-cluster containining protein
MIQINCNGCTNHCCGVNPHLTPILLPFEEAKFKKYAQRVQTPYRELWILAKKENGNCIFLNDKTIRCEIYLERPLECRLYPFLLDYSKGQPDVKLDERFCPGLKTLHSNKESISALVQKQQFPKNWIDAYKTLEDY